MPTEREKMLGGEMYDPLAPELVAARGHARDLCRDLNATRDSDGDERRRTLRELFATGGDTVWMQPPFHCDYGSSIELGERVFFNFNCVVLDVCRVRIGSRAVIGAGSVVTRGVPDDVFAAGHPCRVIRSLDRNSEREKGGYG